MNPFSIFKRESAAEAARNRARDRVGSAAHAPDWTTVREPLCERDRALSRDARAWLVKLPPRAKLAATAQLYPRIVNRLALCWNDPMLLERLFNEMLVDRRGKRRGFPPDVTRELLALREHAEMALTAEEDSDAWASRMQATTDR
jgi:hypothetical protein